MRGGWTKQLVSALAVVLLFCAVPAARAEFSPRWGEMAAGEGMTLKISGHADVLEPLSASSLDIVNGWLEKTGLSLAVQRKGGIYLLRAEAMWDGDSLLTLTQRQGAAGTLTVFGPSGSAYFTGAERPDALSLLTGENDAIPDFSGLPAAYLHAAPGLFSVLKEETAPKTTRESTSIKYAGSSASYETYLFKDGKMNDVWPRAIKALLPALEECFRDQPLWRARAEKWLRDVAFSGETRVKRFLDKAGNDMGLQVTGQIEIDGEARKLTLYGGFTPDRGGYFSLSLPPVKGKNNLKITFGGRVTEKNGARTLTLEGTYSRTRDGDARTVSLEGTVKNAVKDGREAWSGKITAEVNQNRVKSAWTVTPDLIFTDEGLSGTVGVQKKQGSAVTLKMALTVNVTPGAEIAVPNPDAAKNLAEMEDDAARAAVLSEWPGLARTVVRLMASLPEKERALLTHDLRTDQWMNGPAVPVTSTEAAGKDQNENPWIVEEEEDL